MFFGIVVDEYLACEYALFQLGDSPCSLYRIRQQYYKVIVIAIVSQRVCKLHRIDPANCRWKFGWQMVECGKAWAFR
jgi:hypothetical protein